MKYMVHWRMIPERYEETARRFLAHGAPVPEGVTSLGRWHSIGADQGWHLMEGDTTAMMEHAAEWATLLHIEIVPVVEDAEAGAAVGKVYG